MQQKKIALTLNTLQQHDGRPGVARSFALYSFVEAVGLLDWIDTS